MDAPYAIVEQLEPGVARLLASNPSPFTYFGTQTYLVGDEELVVIDPGPDGAYGLPPVAAGWPSLAGAISPASLVDAAGATVNGPSPHALVLRLRVDDPTTESSFTDVGIVYRSGPVRHEKRLEYTQRIVPGTCT